MMNARFVRAIVRKDLKVVAQSKGVLIPLIVVPLVMFVALPVLASFLPALNDASEVSSTGLGGLLEQMPGGLQDQLAGYSEDQQLIVLALVYFLAPMYLIVPLMVASVIAADSFAGEKERKTLEALIYTPTTDLELFVGKLLSAWIPALAVALLGFLLYGSVANLVAWPTMGRIFFPNVMWLMLVLWVTPAVAGLGLGVTVLLSARAQGFQDAYQTGAIVVLPLLLLVISQVTGVMYFSLELVLLLGLILWIVDAALVWFGARTFQRDEIIARL
jgi:ABC-2 type transport system permease protein